MSFSLVNFFNTTLSAASSNTATTFTVSSSANLPTLASGEVLPIILNDAATRLIFEICYVTSISGNVLTVERAQEGTSAQNWNVGDYIWNGPTAGTALLQNTTDPFTTSGLITADGGIDVAGGSITIPNATANNEPVALGQFLGPITNANSLGSLAASTTYTVTITFTAPSAGYVWGQGRLILAQVAAAGSQLAVLVNGVKEGADNTVLPMIEAGVVSVTDQESVTVTAQLITGSTSPGVAASLYVDVIFIPALSN